LRIKQRRLNTFPLDIQRLVQKVEELLRDQPRWLIIKFCQHFGRTDELLLNYMVANDLMPEDVERHPK
jgi:hypothetical protein